MDVTAYLDPIKYIKDLYDSSKKAIPDLNWSTYASLLGLPKTNSLYLVTTGRRTLTVSLIKRVIETIGFKGHKKRYFLSLVEYINAKDQTSKENAFREVLRQKSLMLKKSNKDSELIFYSNWLHIVIVQAIRLFGNVCSREQLEAVITLAVNKTSLDRALKTLVDIEAIERVGESFKVTPKQYVPSAEVIKLGARAYHRQTTEMAQNALENIPMEMRDFNSFTISVAEKEYAKVKNIILEMGQKLLKLESQCSEPNVVLHLNQHMFLVANNVEKKAEKNVEKKDED